MARSTPRRKPAVGAVPLQQRGIDKRRRVYEAALKEFARHGVEHGRVDEIVEAAGVAWGTFFHYFPRKEDVLLAAGVELQRRHEAAMDAAVADGASSIREIVGAAYESMATPQHTTRLHVDIAREVLASPNRYEQLLGGGQPLYARVAALLEIGQQRGEIRADVDAATMARILNSSVLVSLSRVGIPGATGLPRDADLAELVRTTFRVVWAGMEAAAEGRPPLSPADR